MSTWLTVVRSAHRKRLRHWLECAGLLIFWTVVASICAILFIEEV
jgi:hypothetical protein